MKRAFSHELSIPLVWLYYSFAMKEALTIKGVKL